MRLVIVDVRKLFDERAAAVLGHDDGMCGDRQTRGTDRQLMVVGAEDGITNSPKMLLSKRYEISLCFLFQDVNGLVVILLAARTEVRLCGMVGGLRVVCKKEREGAQVRLAGALVR
jgi:hypothetical protein